MRNKIVLAYSGGLDTSVLVRILTDDYGYDVICCHADVGEARDPEKITAKAMKAGAVAVEIAPAQEEFAKDFCFPALQANALYQGVYPLSAALSRPLIARHLVAVLRGWCFSNRETGNPVAGLPLAPASSRRRPAYARVCSASVYRARQTRTSSKNSPARRPVRRFTCRVTRSSRRSPASARIRG